MDSGAALAFLRDQIPVRDQVLLPGVFRSAYTAVAEMVKDSPFLKVPSAKYNRGRLVTWAVDSAIENHIKAGSWNVDYRWVNFGSPRPTGSYLEIYPSHSRVTISQVADPRKQPRNVDFRENARLFNTPFLFEEMQAEANITGRPGLLLVHGHQDFSFLHFGVPHATRRYGYIARTANLLLLPQEVMPAGMPVEDTSFRDATITLKEQIAKWLKDNGG